MKDLKSLLEVIREANLYPWVKNVIALSQSIEPLIKDISPWVMTWIILRFLEKLLGL